MGERLGSDYLSSSDRDAVDGRVVPPALVERGCRIDEDAHVGSLVVLGEGVSVGRGSTIERSVVLNGAEIGAGCTLRGCIVAAGARIGDDVQVTGGAVLGEGVTVGDGNVLTAGLRLAPGTELPAGAIRF